MPNSGAKKLEQTSWYAIFRTFDCAALNGRTAHYNEAGTQYCYCQLLYLLTLLLISLKMRVSLEYV
jgi:hypothetical protein